MGDSKRTNSDIEWEYFSKFREFYGIPKGVVVRGDKPDIIIELDGKDGLLGIEIVRLFGEDGIAKIIDQQNKIMEEARFIYLRGRPSDRNVSVSVIFNDDFFPVTRKRSQNLSIELARLIEKCDPGPDHKISSLDFFNLPELLSIYKYVNSWKPEWGTPLGYSVPGFSENRFHQIIASKKKKSAEYTPTNRIWLLIVVDFWEPGTDQEFPHKGSLVEVDPSPFEKILLWHCPFENIIEFQPRTPSGF